MSDFAFNFRLTEPFVADGTDQQFVIAGDNQSTFPKVTAFGIGNITWGFTVNNGFARNRDSGIDPRLAGIAGTNNGGGAANIFRVNLPSTGKFAIELASGDASFSADNYVRVFDNTTLKIDVAGATSASGSFIDATLVSRTAANWPANNVPLIVDFANTECFVEIGSTDVQSGTSALAHISFTAIAGPTITTIAPDPAITGVELTLTTTGAEAVQGTGGVDQEQGAIVESLTINAWADLEVKADSAIIEDTQLKYGTQTARLTNDSGEDTTKTFVAAPLTNQGFVDIVTPHTPQSERLISDPDLNGSEQIRYADVLFQGGSPVVPNLSVVVNDDATGSVNGATPDGTYQIPFRVWDDADQTWGTEADQTVIIGAPPSGGIVSTKLSIGIGIGI